MPSKMMSQEKRKKKGGGEKAKSKSQDCCVTFNPKNNLGFFAFCACPNFAS